MDTIRTADAPPTHWVSIKEACDILGLSDDTIRRRIQAGTIPARKDQTPSGTRWLVEIDPPADDARTEADRNADAAPTHAEVLAAMQKVIDALEREREEMTGQLRTREREVAELHVLLQHTTRQQAMLAPPQDYRNADETPTHSVEIAHAVPTQSSKGFWKRLFGTT